MPFQASQGTNRVTQLDFPLLLDQSYHVACFYLSAYLSILELK